MKKFDWSEARKFWEVRDAEWAKTDHTEDTESLQNLIHAGQPLWFSRRWAGYMEAAYKGLFDLVPPPGPGANALDVGCGAGKWSRFLADRGYRTVGIDIQSKMIEENKCRHPDIEFHSAAIQEYSPGEKFDLVSSSTVIQHNPLAEQYFVVRKIRELLESGGHVIVLESARETPDPFTFPRDIEGWTKLFEGSGFRTLAVRRYHYNLFLRLSSRIASVGRGPRRLGEKGSTQQDLGNSNLEELARISAPRKGHPALDLAKRMAVELDARAEPVLSRANVPLGSYHCGFLFQAV